jgi:hypothetical protein
VTAVLRTAALVLAAVLAASSAAQAGGRAAVKVTLAAPTHSPRTGVKWRYAVRATVARKPAVARITAEIVDPLGGVHPVELGDTTKPTVKLTFRGVFRDFVRWPAESRGIPLTFRVTVLAGGKRKVIAYRVTPRA